MSPYINHAKHAPKGDRIVKRENFLLKFQQCRINPEVGMNNSNIQRSWQINLVWNNSSDEFGAQNLAVKFGLEIWP